LFWIEDKIINCQVGIELGLKSLLVEHGHNMEFANPMIPKVKNWREIYEIIVSDHNNDRK